MRLIAVQTGFYKDSRRRVGVEFDMPEKDMKKGKDGAVVLPKWAVEATPENRAKYAGGTAVIERQRGLDGVKAAGGPKRAAAQSAKLNPDDGSELV